MIGGIEQAITIRGHDPSAPVLLALHGGPGGAQIGFSHLFQTGWERDFIVVEWDQRGAGKTRISKTDYDVLTIDLIYSDAEEVVSHLRERFGQDKIFVLGWSWGSIIGIRLAHEHPEWFHAYIGTGQVVDWPDNETASYAFALRAALDAEDAGAIATLQEIEPPPYPADQVKAYLFKQREILMAMGGAIKGNSMSPLVKAILTSPDYTIGDVLNFNTAINLSIDALLVEMMELDVREMGLEFDLPMFFLHGRQDYLTSASLAEAYIESVSAPSIETIWFEDSAHYPLITEAEKFTEVLREKVRPLAD
jgi:pimeloyl-ACP methyl ester carboxylesterase